MEEKPYLSVFLSQNRTELLLLGISIIIFMACIVATYHVCNYYLHVQGFKLIFDVEPPVDEIERVRLQSFVHARMKIFAQQYEEALQRKERLFRYSRKLPPRLKEQLDDSLNAAEEEVTKRYLVFNFSFETAQYFGFAVDRNPEYYLYPNPMDEESLQEPMLITCLGSFLFR